MDEGLVEMFRYNTWANRELFEMCRTLTDEQLDTHSKATSGPIRELLMHIVGGQQTFILRTRGRQNEGELSRWSTWPGMETLIDIVTQTSEALLRIAENLQSGEEVDLPYQGKLYRFPKRFFLLHAIQHGIEHRTELKLALAHIGIKTPDLDGWNYARAAGYGQEHS
jgi:uncharacterized damage-inducible protein DinB